MSRPAPASFLQIHLPERFPDAVREPPVRWSRRAGTDLNHGVSYLGELPPADEIMIVLPVARLAFARAALPRGPAVKLAKLAPFVIEDAIICSLEDMHCVVLDEPPREGPDAERLVAVIGRDWFASALAELALFGIEPDRAIAESALISDADGIWTVVWSGDGGFAAPGGVEAIALDASVDGCPPLALKLAVEERRRRGAPPRAVRVLLTGVADPPDVAKWSDALDLPVALTGKWLPEERDAREAKCPDLLPSSSYVAWVASEWLARLRPAAVLAVTLIAVYGLLTLGDWAWVAYEAQGLRQDMDRALPKALPDAKAVDPALSKAADACSRGARLSACP
jgi:type II secretion system protein L